MIWVEPLDYSQMGLSWEFAAEGAHDARVVLDDWAKLDEFIAKLPDPETDPQFEVLIEQAQQAAEERGHTLSSFEKVKDYPIWQATCGQCGQTAAVNLDPPAGEPDVYGDAVSGVCPEAEVSETEVSTEKTSEENAWYDDLANPEKR